MASTIKRNPIVPGATVAVVGAGASGSAAARLARAKGARVRLLERNPDNVDQGLIRMAAELGIEIVTGPHDPVHFQDVSLVVTSPGVPFAVLQPLLDAAGSPPLIGELEFAWRLVAEPVLAITGTSGKTTTASLAAAMLREAGRNVFLGGNIGTPLSDYVLAQEPADVLVLEVSSFQLMGCDTFQPHVGVLLNISPNHLDQHESMHEYVDAKFSLFARQTSEDVAIFGTELEDEVPVRGIKARIGYFTITGRFANTRLLGRHNQANIEAAYMACAEFGVTEEEAARAAAMFEPLPHRLEMVAEKEGVLYVNDSKCTTVDALRVALSAMDRPVVLLAGGVFKGGNLDTVAGLVRGKVKAVALFGAGRDVFTIAWDDKAPLTWSPDLAGALAEARKKATAGDVILLAPATSSFDLYHNYKERGEDFKRLVQLG